MKKSRDNLETNRVHLHEPEAQVAAFQRREEKHTIRLSPIVVLLIVWIVLFLLSLFFVVSYDQAVYSIAWIFKNAASNMQHFYNFIFSAGDTGNIEGTFFRLIGTALVGAALASCGSLMQGSYRNVIAGPSTTGVMAGGSLGCVIYLLLFEETVRTATVDRFFYNYAYQFCILGGALFGTVLILTISRVAGKGKLSPSAMLISGMVFSGLIGNINMIIQYYMIVKDPSDTRIEMIRDMMLGSFENLGSVPVLLMMGIPLGVCFVIMLFIRGKLNLLSMGDDEAQISGMNVQRYRLLMMLLSAILTALTMAFCGRIGFVGFMVPLVTRRIVGPDMRRIVPCSLLTGAVILTIIQDLATILSMLDSISVITSSIGCVVMAVTLLRRGGAANTGLNGHGAGSNPGIRSGGSAGVGMR